MSLIMAFRRFHTMGTLAIWSLSWGLCGDSMVEPIDTIWISGSNEANCEHSSPPWIPVIFGSAPVTSLNYRAVNCTKGVLGGVLQPWEGGDRLVSAPYISPRLFNSFESVSKSMLSELLDKMLIVTVSSIVFISNHQYRFLNSLSPSCLYNTPSIL